MKSWSCSMVVSVPSGFVRTKRKDQSWDGWRVGGRSHGGPASAWLRRSEYPKTATAQKALFMAAHGTPAYIASFLLAA